MKAILLTLLALSSAINVQAALVTKPVTYDDKGTKLVGYLAYDDAVASKGKPPGILVIHEWWGLNDYIKGRAKQLAKMGYVAFAADIFGDGETIADPEKARELSSKFYGKPLMAERAQAGMDQLLKTGLVDEKKIAAIAQKTKAKFLVLHGALDPLVGKDAVDTFLKAMNEGKFDFQFIEYSGAIHAFTNPNADKTSGER
jgi:dienelactone hydrolase